MLPYFAFPIAGWGINLPVSGRADWISGINRSKFQCTLASILTQWSFSCGTRTFFFQGIFGFASGVYALHPRFYLDINMIMKSNPPR